jgi:DNA-binding transcriptional LysR family regulator
MDWTEEAGALTIQPSRLSEFITLVRE